LDITFLKGELEMEEKVFEQKEQEKTLVSNINLTTGLVAVLIAALLIMVFVGYQALNYRHAAAAGGRAPAVAALQMEGSSTAPRRYYLTSLGHTGNDTTNVCTDTFHMAAIWELMDVSNLEYAVDLAPGTARVRDDNGEGPPSGDLGWVRTGQAASTVNTAGQANCDVWTSNSSGEYGTVIALPPDWINNGPNMSIWSVQTTFCSNYILVWCIED
jgi:hypothetical protein